MNISAILDIVLGRVRVEDTFSLRWTRRYHFDFVEQRRTEAVVQKLPRKERGGIIVFPVDVSGVDGIRALQFAKTWVDALSKKPNPRAEQVMKEIPSAFCVRRHFLGRYRSRAGTEFDRSSLTLEVLGLTKHELIKLATLLTRELGQESVLASVNATRVVYFVAQR